MNTSKEELKSIVELKSIFDTIPDDFGGIFARQGFAFQDDVAASLYLHMLKDQNLLEVSCETYDDILLVWNTLVNKTIEFVQVKAEHIDQLWTVAKLCEKTISKTHPKGVGTSILEKSLARDRYKEISCFRIVTCRQIDSELDVLKTDRTHSRRTNTDKKYSELVSNIKKRLPDFVSMNQNDITFWLKNTLWEIFDEKYLETINHSTLAQVLHSLALPSDPDMVRVVYDQLRVLAKSTAEYDSNRWNEKRVTREALIQKLKTWVDPFPNFRKNERLEKKLTDAGLDIIAIDAAKDHQRAYLRKLRSAGYLMPQKTEEVEQQVLDTLHSLRSSLDSGRIQENGVKFHDRCLQAVRHLKLDGNLSDISLNCGDISGCMYEITSRCRHRFIRPIL